MDLPEITELYDKYREERQIQIDKAYFDTLVMYFPSLLVVACDGVVDDEEWFYVKYLSKFMADTYRDVLNEKERDQLEVNYFDEFKFLLDNLETWEEAFISVLKKYLSLHPEEKEDVIEVLQLFADASEGVSDEETEKIEELKEVLDLEGEDI